MFLVPFVGRPVSRLILGKQLKVEGIQGQRWASEWPIAFKEMAEWIQEVSYLCYFILPHNPHWRFLYRAN